MCVLSEAVALAKVIQVNEFYHFTVVLLAVVVAANVSMRKCAPFMYN